jgi:alpha/beta superfamily hydrolase
LARQASTDSPGEKIFSERIAIPFDQGHLEGVLAYEAERARADGIILLSPHPNFAGTMDNNVTKELATFLSTSGFIVLRFNYPGIGESSLLLPPGMSSLDYWDRVEKEQRFEEALRPSLAAMTFLEKSLGTFLNKIHLVGYSYGATIGLMMAEQVHLISSVTAISLPWVSRYQYDFLKQVPCRKLFITGKQDFALDPAVQQRVWPHVAEPKKFTWVDGDHFFRKKEKELGKQVLDFLVEDQG